MSFFLAELIKPYVDYLLIKSYMDFFGSLIVGVGVISIGVGVSSTYNTWSRMNYQCQIQTWHPVGIISLCSFIVLWLLLQN